MTKKDYELIARIFAKNVTTTNTLELKHNVPVVAKAMAHQFADVLAKDNPKFNKVKFLAFCGIEGYNFWTRSDGTEVTTVTKD